MYILIPIYYGQQSPKAAILLVYANMSFLKLRKTVIYF